jgi:AbrB family looped-hinge helix DNA binding protein
MPLLTSKGQVTIPKSIREVLHVKEGDSVVFEEVDGTVFVKKEERKSILRLGGIASGGEPEMGGSSGRPGGG